MTEEPLSRTGILRAELGQAWRWWVWFARQFTPTSLSAIGTIISLCGLYIIHLREDVATVRERVVVLETRVIPVIQSSDEITKLEDARENHEQRIKRIENNLDMDYNETEQARQRRLQQQRSRR